MIPPFNTSMVLPPFVGADPTRNAGMAPYPASMLEVAQRFGTSQQRVQILEGLLRYRKGIAGIVLPDGFQWLDGSFVEDVETAQNRPPNDIDIVTFAVPNVGRPQIRNWLQTNQPLLVPSLSKSQFLCDAYFVDLSKAPRGVVSDTRYWFGLFGHQRKTLLWKGMIEVPLSSDDDQAEIYLKSLCFP